MDKYDSYKESGVYYLETIPSHWLLLKGKYIFNQEKRPVRAEDEVVTCFRDGQVTLRKNRRTEGFTNSEKEIGYQGIRTGDLVIHNMDAFAGAIGISDSDGKATPVYAVCTPKRDDINPMYYCYYLRYLAKRGFIQSLAKGIRERSTDFRFGDFKELVLPVPPISEQTKIISYINEQCSKIDEAIAQQQKMIDLLNERKQIAIDTIVTGGLDADIEMKSTSLKWLPLIPKNWSIIKLKYLAKLKGRIGWNGLKSEEFKTLSYAYLVTGQDFRGSNIAWDKCYQINKKRYDEDPFIQLSNGDLLITKDGSIGKIAKVNNLDKPACLNSGIFVLKQTKGLFVQDYLYWMLKSKVFKEFNTYNQTGATVLHLYQNVFEQMPCIIPPKDEQIRIASFLNEECEKYDKAISMFQQKIELLSQRKQVIISEVVTGKIRIL